MKRSLIALILLVSASAILSGCSGGQISDTDQQAKAKALDKIASQSPDADKVEK